MTEQIPLVDPSPVAAARGRLDDAALADLIDGLPAADFPYLAARSPAEAVLGARPPSLSPAAYDDGRLFGPGGDIHWRREAWLGDGAWRSGWRVVFIGGRAHCPPALAAEPCALADHVAQQDKVLLWGERRGSQTVWHEPRIPRVLDYGGLLPGNPRRVAMTVVRYVLDGRVDFVRFLGFAPWH